MNSGAARGSDTVAAAAAVGPPPGLQVRLSSNESPFGPSPAVLDVLREGSSDVHLYPDDQSGGLREAIAGHELTEIDRVAVGTGSAGLLMDLIAHECLRDGDPRQAAVLTYERAFIVYRLGAQNLGAQLDEAPLASRFVRDPDALLQRLTDRTRIVLLDNPSNPTGRHLDADQLRYLLDRLPDHVTVVVDEAYHQFASGQQGYQTVPELGTDHPRLVTVRTFSKAYALAGLRVGYLLGPSPLVGSLDAFRLRFNVNGLAQRAAVAAIGDTAHLARTVSGTLEGRRRMGAGLEELGVPFVDGLGNFLLIDLGQPAGPIVGAFAELGVGVRSLPPYRMDEHIRVTVGTPAEVDRFLEVSSRVLGSVASRGR